jgi:predicted nucleic acid-binding protein
MIVLDTNVLSELMRRQPDSKLVAWIDAQLADALMLSAVTVAELLYGIARLPEGKRKADLHDAAWMMLKEEFDERILSFDALAAVHYASLVAQRESSGRPISMADAQIAAICLSHEAILATRNGKDFSGLGLTLVNPWLE